LKLKPNYINDINPIFEIHNRPLFLLCAHIAAKSPYKSTSPIGPDLHFTILMTEPIGLDMVKGYIITRIY